MKVKDLLTKENQWIQFRNALDKNNFPVEINSSFAVKFCLMGAIVRCYPDFLSQRKISERVLQKIRNKGFSSITDWNDSCYRRFSEIKTLINKLNI